MFMVVEMVEVLKQQILTVRGVADSGYTDISVWWWLVR